MRRQRPFTILALLVASVAVTPVTSMDLVNGTLGHPVDFTIPVALPSQYRVDWNCGHAGTVAVIARLTGSGRSPQYNPEYTGRCDLLENGTLRLKSVSYEDEGTYNVKVFNPDTFTSYIQRYQLAVYAILGAPVLISKSPLVSGTNVTLHCDSGSQNVTTYTFYRGEKMICSEPHVTCRGAYLDLTPITESDSGSYTCSIQNPVSSSTSDPLSLTVSAPVSAVSLTSNTSGALWAGQDSVSLYCTAQGSDITFSWRMNGLPVSSNPPYYITEGESPSTSTLTISSISRNHTGPFTCTAANRLNSETSPEINLNVNSYPEGNIECTAQGHHSMLQFSCSWPGGRPAANVTMIYNNVLETRHHEVTRHVSVWQIAHSSNLTCIGEYFGETFSCSLIFGTSEDKSNPITIKEGERTKSKSEARP
ncbi:cell adhesion molecule CEACAM6-like [Leptodactylus fuscus]